MMNYLPYIFPILLALVYSQETLKAQRQHWIPKIIWTWWGNNQVSYDHKLQIFDFHHRAAAKGWEVRHLTYNSQEKWLSQIPDNNGILHSQYFKNALPIMRSNLVRLLVLKHFGGLYIDFHVMLTQPLDWLLNIKKEDGIQNKFGDEPDVFLTYNSRGSYQRVKDENGKAVLFRPTFEDSIIAARPKSKFIQQWCQKKSYEKFGSVTKSIAMDIVRQNNFNTFIYIFPYQQQPICAQIVLQMKQKQLDEEWENDKSKARQFAVKHYKIWTIGTKDTIFKTQQAVDFKNDLIMKIMFRLSVQQSKQLNFFPKYFMKFYGDLQRQLGGYWLNSINLKNASCPIQNYILEDSIIYQYLLKDYPTKFYLNPVVKTPADMDCNKIKSTAVNQNIKHIKFGNLQTQIENISQTQNQKKHDMQQINKTNTQIYEYLRNKKIKKQGKNNQKQMQHWIPKIIWTWWDKQISSNNHHLKIFEFNHKAMAKGWEIRHLDYTNQQKWISKVTGNYGILYSNYFQSAMPTKRSQLVRLMVLKQFGGLYIDYNVVLTQPLDWLLDIKNQAVVQNKFGEEPDILLTYNSAWGSSERVKDENGNDVLWRPTFENSIIACKPGAEFVQRWYEKFVQIRKQSHLKYGNDQNKSTTLQIAQQQGINTFYQNQPSWQQPISAQIVMQLKQKQFDRIWNLDKSKPRQFAVKHYKIWALDTLNVSLLLAKATQFTQLIPYITIKKLFQTSIQQIKNSQSFPKYFMKLNSSVRTSFNNYFLNEESIKKAKCPIQNYILEDSIAYQYLLKDYPFKFYSNPVVKNANEIDCSNSKEVNQLIQQFKVKISQNESHNTKDIDNSTLIQLKQWLKVLVTKIEKIQIQNFKQSQKQKEFQQNKLNSSMQTVINKKYPKPENAQFIQKSAKKNSINFYQLATLVLFLVIVVLFILKRKRKQSNNYPKQVNQNNEIQILETETT